MAQSTFTSFVDYLKATGSTVRDAYGEVQQYVSDAYGDLQRYVSEGDQIAPYQKRNRDAFDPQTFDVTGTSYPTDLMSPTNPYGNNYVVFYISAHEDSEIIKDRPNATVPGGLGPRVRGQLSGSNVSETGVRRVGSVAAAIGAGTAAKALAQSLGGTDIANNIAAAVGAGAGYVAADTIIDKIGGATAEYKTLKKAIAMYIPGSLQTRYGVMWGEDDLAVTAAFATGLDAAGAGINEFDLQKVLNTGTSYVASAALRTPGLGQAISRLSGVAGNPKKEQLFERVDFRNFQFSYSFCPRSPEETRAIQEIIKQFKLHMHPEFKRNSNNFLYVYPSEFDIRYYTNGRENLNIHRHGSCVLTNLTVTYGAEMFSSHPDGMPTRINMQMEFRELGLLTKENIQDGF